MRAAMEAENLEKRIDALEAKSANSVMPFKPKVVA
jgi:BMFP domain-containing protein YqiC